MSDEVERYRSLRRWLAVGLLAAPGLVSAIGWGAIDARPATVPSTRPTAMAPATARVRRPARAPQRELTPDELAAVAERIRAAYSVSPDKWPPATVDPGVKFEELGRLPPPTFPDDNPYTAPKEALGKQLFFDPRLSGSGEIACASCHEPDLAWCDGRTVSFGHGRTALRRNAPSVQLSAYATTLFWDGRAPSLEAQAHMPVTSHDEMNGGDAAAVARRLDAVPEYHQSFKAVFGADHVTMDDVARAVATFERSLGKTAGRSDFDRFVRGRYQVLSDSAVRGLNLFRTTARCINCHNGPALTDNLFHNNGLSFYGRANQDLGRYEITHLPADVGRFRTPTLRNVTRTRPYTHNGLLELDGLIASYNTGMPTARRTPKQKDDPLFPTKDVLLKPLGLTEQDEADLKAFLESLSDPPARVRPPVLPPDAGPAGGTTTAPAAQP